MKDIAIKLTDYRDIDIKSHQMILSPDNFGTTKIIEGMNYENVLYPIINYLFYPIYLEDLYNISNQLNHISKKDFQLVIDKCLSHNIIEEFDIGEFYCNNCILNTNEEDITSVVQDNSLKIIYINTTCDKVVINKSLNLGINNIFIKEFSFIEYVINKKVNTFAKDIQDEILKNDCIYKFIVCVKNDFYNDISSIIENNIDKSRMIFLPATIYDNGFNLGPLNYNEKYFIHLKELYKYSDINLNNRIMEMKRYNLNKNTTIIDIFNKALEEEVKHIIQKIYFRNADKRIKTVENILFFNLSTFELFNRKIAI